MQVLGGGHDSRETALQQQAAAPSLSGCQRSVLMPKQQTIWGLRHQRARSMGAV